MSKRTIILLAIIVWVTWFLMLGGSFLICFDSFHSRWLNAYFAVLWILSGVGVVLNCIAIVMEDKKAKDG